MGYGVQRFYVFFNGYGASVVKYLVSLPEYEDPVEGSLGATEDLWELAVLEIDYPVVPGELPFKWTLCYYTGLTPPGGTIGYLSDEKVEAVLEQIEQLPSRSRDVIAL